jgi:hypothetical protein
LSNRPPVFTNRCCKLVSDQFSILFGSTSRRQQQPGGGRSRRSGLLPLSVRGVVRKFADSRITVVSSNPFNVRAFTIQEIFLSLVV